MMQLLVARVGRERFGFPVAGVLEALDAPVVHPLPLAHVGLLGRLFLRDEALPVVDLGWALGVPRQGEGPGVALLLRAGAAGRVAGLVDEVEDLVRVEDGMLRPAPSGWDGMLAGVGQDPRGLIGVVSTDAVAARCADAAGARG